MSKKKIMTCDLMLSYYLQTKTRSLKKVITTTSSNPQNISKKTWNITNIESRQKQQCVPRGNFDPFTSCGWIHLGYIFSITSQVDQIKKITVKKVFINSSIPPPHHLRRRAATRLLRNHHLTTIVAVASTTVHCHNPQKT